MKKAFFIILSYVTKRMDYAIYCYLFRPLSKPVKEEKYAPHVKGLPSGNALWA